MVYVVVVTNGIKVIGVLAVFRFVDDCKVYAKTMQVKLSGTDVSIKFYMREFDKVYDGCDQPNNIDELPTCLNDAFVPYNPSKAVYVVVTVHESGRLMGVPAVFEHIAKGKAYTHRSNALLSNSCVQFRVCLRNINQRYCTCEAPIKPT